jgi:hypothetical protein
MLAWMHFCKLPERIGVELSYDVRPLRPMQNVGVEALEITTLDTHDRCEHGKNNYLDAQNAVHAALTGKRTFTHIEGAMVGLSLCACPRPAEDCSGCPSDRAADDSAHDRQHA